MKDMKMTVWKDGYVEANNIRIHYYQTGGNKPQIVLNHGAMDDGLCWTRVAKELEQDYDVIMFDSRGHGLSDSGQGDYRPETRAKDTAEAIQKLGLDKPVIGGHSMGAEASLYVAALYPDLLSALFMEDPPVPMPDQPMFGGEMGENGEKVIKMMARMMTISKIMPQFIGKMLAKKMMPGYPDVEIIPWLNSKKRIRRDFMNGMASAGDSIVQSPSPFDMLKDVQVPTLLIRGDREMGAIISDAAATEMEKTLPGLQVAHLRGASHNIRRDKFDDYIRTLRAFLAEIDN